MPNDNVIDNLSIQVKAEAQSASTVIDGLATRLTNLSNVLKGFTKKKINIGVNAEQVEILRQFSNAIEDLSFAKLNAFANLTQQIKKINIGLKGEDGTNMSMFAMGLEDLNIEKFRQYAEVSKEVAKISLGIGDKSGAGFSTFVDSLNRADTGKMQAFADAFRDFGGVHIGFQDAGVKSLSGFITAMNSADMDKMTQFADAFREFGGVHIGITEKGADAFKAFADASSSLSETALENLRSLSSIDFSNLKPLADAAQGMKALTNATVANAPATEKAEKAQKKLATATRSVRHATHRAHHTFNLANTALGKLFNSIKRIAFYRMIRSAIKSVTQGFAEGIENLYRWSQAWNTSFAPAMDQLKTAQLYLKNGFASMFSPLIEYAIPIIDRLVDKLVDMFNILQQFFAQLTGAKTWNKAIKYPVKYKEDLDKAGKSAKALQNILMDFDEINAINTPNDATRGSTSGAEDYSKMFSLEATPTGNLFNLGKINPLLEDLGKFVDDLKDKGSRALKKIKELGSYILSLNFNPLRLSLKKLWETLSPILDYFINNSNDQVFKPLSKFFVEDGLPTAIDAVRVAISSLWELIKPILDSGFLRDLVDKLSKINDLVAKFIEFVDKLDFSKMGDALAKFWKEGLSPIFDWFTDNAAWFNENVLQPITQFLVEKGIPAAIDAITEALKSIKAALEPVVDGLKKFWEDNGTWIMEMLEEHTMTALDKIKELFQKIGGFFTKNGDKIRSIFENISKVIKDLSPMIKWLAGALGTHAWDTFVDSILTILDAVQPVLDLVSGLLNLLTAAGDMEKAKKGLMEIGQALWDAIIAPVKIALRAIATLLDALGQNDAAHALRVFIGDEEETAVEAAKRVIDAQHAYEREFDLEGTEYATDQLANMVEQIRKIGPTSKEEFDLLTAYSKDAQENGIDPLTGGFYTLDEAIGKLDTVEFDDVNAAVNYLHILLYRLPESAREAFTKTDEWANYCKGYGLDPAVVATEQIGYALETLPTTAETAFNKVYLAGESSSRYFASAWSTSLGGLAAAAEGIGEKIGKNLLNNAQAALNMSPLQIKATVIADVNGVNVNDKWRAALAAAGVPISGFASGGFPSPSSLFYAGEGGVPELMGTVGGRTAVAGGQEITGIREAIEARGQREEGLLRQLISAVMNKDLTLVANSKTGRWVNQSLKAYAGVTG